MSDQPYTDDQLQAVKDQVASPPVGTGPSEADMAAKTAGGSPTEVDVNALLARLQAQQDAMAAEITRLKAGQAPQGEHPLITTAKQARDLIAQHFDNGYKGDGPAVTRLADDMIDAATNAVSSGDTAAVRQVARKLERELNRIHPGPGDHHYFKAALGLVSYHLHNAADTVTEAKPSDAPALGSDRSPARVISGSVTG